MILLKSNGVNCGMEGEKNSPRDIRLRLAYDYGNMIPYAHSTPLMLV